MHDSVHSKGMDESYIPTNQSSSINRTSVELVCRVVAQALKRLSGERGFGGSMPCRVTTRISLRQLLALAAVYGVPLFSVSANWMEIDGWQLIGFTNQKLALPDRPFHIFWAGKSYVLKSCDGFWCSKVEKRSVWYCRNFVWVEYPTDLFTNLPWIDVFDQNTRQSQTKKVHIFFKK